eukprot:GHVR01072216.1.p1 GENE.GHVR01072216.1~~GHVR01072216.1.p1  ORF type:complete len:103 (-),score=0.73 GHVR01072216.1:242-550(-)
MPNICMPTGLGKKVVISNLRTNLKFLPENPAINICHHVVVRRMLETKDQSKVVITSASVHTHYGARAEPLCADEIRSYNLLLHPIPEPHHTPTIKCIQYFII